MNEKIKNLLEEIQDWMLENDYECGPRGSEIYKDISHLLEENDK